MNAEQKAFRDRALVENIRYKFKDRVSNYSDAVLVEAYDNWYFTYEGEDHNTDEVQFLDLIEVKEDS